MLLIPHRVTARPWAPSDDVDLRELAASRSRRAAPSVQRTSCRRL